MPVHELALETVVSRLENGFLLGRALFHPEISACGTDPARVRRKLADLATRVARRLAPWALHRRQPAGAPDVREVVLDEPPPGNHPGWLGPVPLRFQAVVWAHGDEAVIGWIPELDIEVIAPDAARLDGRLVHETRMALLRRRASLPWTASWLEALVWMQRRCEAVVGAETLSVDVRSPREAAEDRLATASRSVLRDVARRLHPVLLSAAYELDPVIEGLADNVLAERPRSVLLVGPPGVGKTAAVHQLVRELRARTREERPFWATSGSRLVAGMSGFGAWQERCQTVREEAARTHAVLHLGGVMELMEVGQANASSESVGDFLQPPIARGELVVIVEATPEQARVLERDHPRMHEALVRVDVREPEPAVARRILRQVAGPEVPDDVLDVVDRLHRRFATYSACPGRPLRFLRGLVDDVPSGRRLRPEDATRAFSRETGLPGLFLDDGLALDLGAAREWIGRRVMGQPGAVDLVVDLLATIKAALARPGRPIASLLFIGPTGVGKTEMARSLAEFLYRSPDRLTRIDMSEYADPVAVERLVGGPGGEGLLTAKVREQPFGVILLDEFEKADPRFFDLLLQVLGEGRLTDAAGRTADFRNTVVVMTSNLGSDSFDRPAPGFVGSSGDPVAHFTAVVRRFLRPELFNRIDRIVPFLPLAEETVVRIAARELDLVGGREGLRDRAVEIEFAPGVAAALARDGFDPRYGARPIKRALERRILAPLAAALNDHGAGERLRAVVDDADGAIRVAVRRADSQARPAASAAAGKWSLREVATRAAWCRRNAEMLADSDPVARMRSELFLLRRAAGDGGDDESTPVDPGAWAARGRARKDEEAIAGLLDRVDAWGAAARDLELRILRGYHGTVPIDAAAAARDLADHAESIGRLLEDLHARGAAVASDVTVGIYGDATVWMRRLALACHAAVTARGLPVLVHAVTSTDPLGRSVSSSSSPLPVSGAARRLVASRITVPEDFLAADHGARQPGAEPRIVGILLESHGFPAPQLLAGEAGIHARHPSIGPSDRCLVDVAPVPVARYVAPAGAARPGGGAAEGRPRRDYRVATHQVTDQPTGRKLPWHDSAPEEARAVRLFLEHRLLETILGWLRG